MSEFRKVINLIDTFIAKEIIFKEFEDDFLKIYLNDSKYDKLTEEQQDFIEEINEKTEYTSDNITEEEREYSWITSDEFREWLERYKEKNIHFWNR